MASTPTLSSPGIGSGLDVNAIVDKLMAVERVPLLALDRQQAAFGAKITAYGALKSAMASLQEAVHGLASNTTFRSLQATPGDATVLAARAAAGATPGSYAVEVGQLAQAQKLAATGFAAASDTVGSGVLTFSFGSYDTGVFTPNTTAGTHAVTIAPGQSSLAGIRDAVNAAHIGVTATIVNDGSATGQRLVLTSDATGAANGLKITVADDDLGNADAAGLSRLAYDPAGSAGAGRNLTQTVAAQDAELIIDGIAIRSASNAVADAIPGVTLTLLKTNAGSPTPVTVARNSGVATTSVQVFVKTFNDLQNAITNLTRYDPAKRQGSILTGDSTARLIQTQLRSLLGSVAGGGMLAGGLTTLTQIGLKTAADGTVSLDTAKLNALLASDPAGVERLFAAVGSATDALITVTSTGKATVAGDYAVDVTQLATQGRITGSAAAALTIVAGVNDALSVRVDGIAVEVTLAAGTYASADALAAEVAARINGNAALAAAGSSVTITQSAGTLSIQSNRYGATSAVSAFGTAALDILGAAPVETAGVDVAGTIGGHPATGAGRTLAGAAGTPVEGLQLNIAGGALGARGTARYTHGIAWDLDRRLTELLDRDGMVASRTDGVNRSVKDVDARRAAMQRRLAAVEAAYRAQFNALDTQLSALTATSNYLQQQLAALPDIYNRRNR